MGSRSRSWWALGVRQWPGPGPCAAGFTATSLSANDDGSTGLVPIGFGIDYFGLSFSDLYVNNNGNVTLDSPLSTYTPFDLTSTGRQILAPFFADVDTRGVDSGVVTYGTDTVSGRRAFGVNWIDVGYYSLGVDPGTFTAKSAN